VVNNIDGGQSGGLGTAYVSSLSRKPTIDQAWSRLRTKYSSNTSTSANGTKRKPTRSKSTSASEGRADMMRARYQVSS
jgi:hypothetical protein